MSSLKTVGLLVLEDFKGFAININGGRLGHVALKIYINFISPITRIIHVKVLKNSMFSFFPLQNVQVGKDQEKAQSEKDSHFKNRGGKKPN